MDAAAADLINCTVKNTPHALPITKAHTYFAKVINVHDGDTVTLAFRSDTNIKVQHSARLARCDAPEVSRTPNLREKALGIAVRDHLKKLLDGVIVEANCLKIEPYGRMLCEAYFISNGVRTNVTDHLLRLGIVREYSGAKKRQPWTEEELDRVDAGLKAAASAPLEQKE